jgi:hypothetical protein
MKTIICIVTLLVVCLSTSSIAFAPKPVVPSFVATPAFKTSTQLHGFLGGDNDDQPTLTRENEPDDYFQT